MFNSNAFSTKNNIFFVRGYVTPQFPRFIIPVIAIIAQFLAQNQNDPMDLAAFKKPKQFFTPEKRKYRFDNNFCFYCGKPGHRIMDHKITIHQINFVILIPITTSSTTIPFVIEIPPAIQQQGKF